MDRVCLNCGSNTTAKHYGQKGEKWYHYNNGYLCHKCRSKLIDKPKWRPIHGAEWNHRRIKFRDKQIIIANNPRKGICSKCGRKVGEEYINYYGKTATVQKTHMHHIQYHNNDPLKDTIELCISCHNHTRWNK